MSGWPKNVQSLRLPTKRVLRSGEAKKRVPLSWPSNKQSSIKAALKCTLLLRLRPVKLVCCSTPCTKCTLRQLQASNTQCEKWVSKNRVSPSNCVWRNSTLRRLLPLRSKPSQLACEKSASASSAPASGVLA